MPLFGKRKRALGRPPSADLSDEELDRFALMMMTSWELKQAGGDPGDELFGALDIRDKVLEAAEAADPDFWNRFLWTIAETPHDDPDMTDKIIERSGYLEVRNRVLGV